MGVLGLTPFLQRICPEVIKTLPDRLHSLSGKTIVIDGTLITQRLHFAPMPHRYRHVLGWYRIVKELQECNVNAICVFDGKERSVAKEQEVERRRHMRKMTAARGVLEMDRLCRLKKLTPLLTNWDKLEDDKRERVTQTLQALVSSANLLDLLETLPLPPDVASGLADEPPGSLPRNIRPRHTVSAHEPSDDVDEFDFEDVSTADTDLNDPDETHESVDDGSTEALEPSDASPVAAPLSSVDTDLSDTDQTYETIDGGVTEVSDGTPSTASQSSEDIASSLAQLYLQYRHSIPKLAFLSEPLQEASATDIGQELSADEPEDAAEAQTEYTMSKTQHQLMLDEGKLWYTFLRYAVTKPEFSGLAATLSTIPAPTTLSATPVTAPIYIPAATVPASDALSSLMEKSRVMSASYSRRTHPPTPETYAESKEILHAMGVPCIEPSGPFEAEALASALVLHGYADYVASEDTDVLVYGVPLVRNIANRNGPLVVISGADARGRLALGPASFVDFALLLGTDFSPRIKNVGPMRALRFIRAHGSIERVLECEPKYHPRVPRDTYLAQIGDARMVFDTLPPIPDVEQLRPRESDEEEVMRVLKDYNLHRIVHDRDWDYGGALSGNYFQDDPTAS